MSSIVVRAEKMAAGGDAIARMADGRVAFVRGALPGESVAVQVVQSKKDFVRAEVVDVLEPSPDRVLPPCPAHALGCGGCSWQHVAPNAQLALKTAIVVEALQRTGKLIDPVVHVGAAVDPWAYRTTLRLASGAIGRLGLRSRNSHDVVALDACPVSHPRLDELLDVVRVTGEGEVSLRVGAATGERSAWTIDDGLTLSGLPDDVAVGSDAVVHDVVAGVRLQVSAASFFQSGPAAAELLVAAVRAASGELAGAHVIDAYGGVGLFASTVTSAAVTVVEGSESACTDAAVNLIERHATIVHSAMERWQPTPADLVIADPSRSGLGRGAVTVLAATEAQRIVLVSCDPVSLARDVGLLRGSGYEHVASTVYDLFPNTHHVEVVTTFERMST
jgi:23S rRNA (uracil1939-C5)-methyltransferase